jgi:phosphoglycolate phosphatase
MHPAPPYRAIIFDFDYTLADSSRGVIDCVNFALENMGLPPAAPAKIRRVIGLSLPETLRLLAGEKHLEKSAEFIRLFTERADSVMEKMTVVYRSVPIAFHRLRGKDRKLGIVSSKYRYRIEALLKREGLLEAVDVIIGGEDVERHKPDPSGLISAVKRLGGSPPQVLFVGDSPTDAETARRAEVAFAAVLTGVTEAVEFRDYPAVKIADDLIQLTDWILPGC